MRRAKRTLRVSFESAEASQRECAADEGLRHRAQVSLSESGAISI